MMDVNVSCKSLDCPYTVTFYGSLFHDVSTRKEVENFPLYHHIMACTIFIDSTT